MSGVGFAVLTQGAATVLTAAAVVVTVLVWLATRTWRPTMPVLLELLLAAGLLRLGVDATWHSIAGAGAIVSIPTVVASGARAAAPITPTSLTSLTSPTSPTSPTGTTS